jgi:cobalt-zinc-cadmium efflux system membrane fusion protein
MTRRGKFAVILVGLVGASLWLTLDPKLRSRSQQAIWKIQETAESFSKHPELPPKEPWAAVSTGGWDGTIALSSDQMQRIGVKTAPVREQSEPIVLRLTGSTDYDPATLTIVRTTFDSRVDRVLVDLGSVVRVGDPLLELFSTELAEAKSTYEAAQSQWVRDKKVLDYKTPLAKSDAIPRKELIEIENDEAQSRLRMKLAKDKLLVYGLTEAEIDAAQNEDGVQKARMILRSRAEGIVIKRSVVQGNFYDSKDELMQIAPLDHLWVRGSVSELDADKVEVGQHIRVIFPYSNRIISSEVEYIDKAIDPEARAARFRTSIRNEDRRLKAGMFVRVLLEIPPHPGQTVIPRTAMVSVDRFDYVFVQRTDGENRFERRPISVARESNDSVLVAEPSNEFAGLRPGEVVMTTGSLVLEQMYEDRLMAEGEVTPARASTRAETSAERLVPTVYIASPK